MILDHIGVAVRDFAKSSTFYRRSFAPLGIETVIEGEGWAMLGRHGKPEFWFGVHGIPPGPLHIGRREVPPGLLRRLRVRSGRP
jgi:catechol 2,3-dioxygenase-like lactoylglutathione lyase family enzyme